MQHHGTIGGRITGDLTNMIVFPKWNWRKINEHIEATVFAENKDQAWLDASREWLEEWTRKLGPQYEVTESERFLLLSAESKRFCKLLLEFSEKTLKRILKALDGIARDVRYGKNIIITFDTEELYYSYVTSYYPNEIENAPNSGLYLNNGHGHFVFPTQDLDITEATLVHELTRACLRHLPIPLPVWLDEGLASTLENECAGYSALRIGKEMLQQHKQFWSIDNIEEFWSGDSFHRLDDGSRFSRELAQVLVRMILSTYDHNAFKSFVLNAHYEDAGERSALENLGISLGDLVSSYLDG